VNCGLPSNPGPNGEVVASLTTFNSVANYSCNSGYELLPDNRVRICQANRMWSGMDPSCEGMNYMPHIKVMLDCSLELISIP